VDAWIKAQDDAKPESGPYYVVFSPQEASSMTENDAREMFKVASRNYAGYVWSVVPSLMPGKFFVQGTSKRR
jgi:hypothetical protein